MAEERNLPPKDARWAKVALPKKHGAPKEILPINNGTKNHTPHFQFTSF